MPRQPSAGTGYHVKASGLPVPQKSFQLKKKKTKTKAKFSHLIFNFLICPFSSANLHWLSGLSTNANIVLVSKRLQFQVQLTAFKTQSCVFSDYH